MTVQQIKNQIDLVGTSTDTKPVNFAGSAIGPGSTFWETDTDTKYVWDGNSWNLFGLGVMQAEDNTSGKAVNLKSIAGAGVVTTAGAPAAIDTRIARFDAAADMPADITSSANVLADLVTMNTFSSTARRIQIIWHGGVDTYSATTGAGPIAAGAFVTINAADATEATDRLTFTDLTGGGTSSSGKTDTVQVSPDNPFIEIITDVVISTIHAVGIPVGVTPTSIVPSFLEVRVIG